MLRLGTQFQFEVPDDWTESKEGSRHVFRGPQGEELIVSSVTVDGRGLLGDRQALEAQVLSNAMQSAREAATQDGLVNIVPLKPEPSGVDVPCWTCVSETPEKDAVFLEVVASSGGGVLLATLEAPHAPEAFQVFRAFLKSLRRPVS